jgi:phosphatidylglycerophosphatase A
VDRRTGPAAVLATCFGLGLAPVAPGTVASLAVAVALRLIHAPPGAARAFPALAALAALSALGVWSAGRAEERYGHDAHAIVIDEAAGMLLSALWVPWSTIPLAAAFLLFRIFDILKPPPAYQLQSLRGGWGVVADDLAAGIYTMVLLFLARALFPGF